MKKLVINKIDKYSYELKDKDNKMYNINIEFYNLKELPKVNDYFYIEENLLKEIENKMINLEVLSYNDNSNKEIIVLEQNNNKIYLERIYG